MADEKKTGENRIIDDKDMEKATGGNHRPMFPGATCPNCGVFFQTFNDYSSHRAVCKEPK